MIFSAILLASVLVALDAFYLPGVSPRVYKKGQTLPINVQSLVSDENPLNFDYFQLPFCKSPAQHEYSENLGEALVGDKKQSSQYSATVLVPEHCKVVCKKEYTQKELQEFHDFAVLDYRVNMRTDNLPLAQVVEMRQQDDEEAEPVFVYELGYPIGTPMHVSLDESNDEFVLNNHLRFTILYHPVEHYDHTIDDAEVFIVGFTVRTASVKHTYDGSWNETCAPYDCPLSSCIGKRFDNTVLPMKSSSDLTSVIFTYDVEWEKSDVKWASRWDVFLRMTNDNIHWFNVVNSIVVIIFLTGVIALIMARILKKDFAMYDQLAQEDESTDIREETGWKLVYGDVFRAPKNATVLACLIGTGLQLTCMAIITLIFAVFGFLSPSNRGALLSTMLMFFCLLGSPAGWISSRFAKYFKENRQTYTAALTGVGFPAVIFALFFVINMFLWARGSSSAVPFGTMLALVLLWFGMSLPLVFFGSFLGFRQPSFESPCRVNSIPRQIPPQIWYLETLPTIALASILPFGVVFVELTVVLSSIWHHRFFYLFGFLFLVLIILIVTVAEVAIVLVYLQLCSENYSWWWRSFLYGSSLSVNLLLYCIYYYSKHVHGSGVVSAVVFTGYSLIICLCVSVLCGFVSFISCFFFIRAIYGSVKID